MRRERLPQVRDLIAWAVSLFGCAQLGACAHRPAEIVLQNATTSPVRVEVGEGVVFLLGTAAPGDEYRFVLDPGAEWRSRDPASRSQKVKREMTGANGFPVFHLRKLDGTDRAWHTFEALSDTRAIYVVDQDAEGVLTMRASRAENSAGAQSALIRPATTEWFGE